MQEVKSKLAFLPRDVFDGIPHAAIMQSRKAAIDLYTHSKAMELPSGSVAETTAEVLTEYQAKFDRENSAHKKCKKAATTAQKAMEHLLDTDEWARLIRDGLVDPTEKDILQKIHEQQVLMKAEQKNLAEGIVGIH